MADFDSLVDDAQQVSVPGSNSTQPSFDSLQDDQEKYGTPGQQAIAGLEGVGQGALGPLVPMAEEQIGIDPKDIRAREETNPITSGVGKVVGLGGSLATGFGEGALMTGAGKLAAEALGAAKVAEGAGLGFKVGSEAVKQAAEMAVLQGSDEISKQILQDPDATAQSALANIGMAAAFGGAGGAFFAGAVNPLWKATVGPKVEALLGGVKGYLEGGTAALPDELTSAVTDLGINPDPILKSAMNGAGKDTFLTLKYAQNKEVEEALNKFHTDISNKVMDSLGIPLDEAQVYSKSEAGHALEDTFKQEYGTKYEPVEKAMEARKVQAENIPLSDSSRLDKYGHLLEKGMREVGTDAPEYKLFTEWGNRLLAKESIGGIDQLKTSLNNDISKAYRAADYNTAIALKSIRDTMADFQESQILKHSVGDKELGSDVLNQRANANRSYAEFAKMSDTLQDHLGLGSYHGAGSLLNKVGKAGPESLLNKFSPKNNADIIPFLQEHFPDTLAHIQKNELKDLIKPAISSAKGESPINVDKLNKIIKDKMAGKKELIDFAINPDALKKIQSAKTLMSAVPTAKDSGTPGGLAKLFKHVPTSAMAMLAMLEGKSPLLGGILGHTAELLGRDVPDSLRLSYLRFLSSETPIKGEGFKAMHDFITNVYKGESKLNKAVEAVVRGGSVAAVSAAGSMAGNEKLDKLVDKFQENPESFMKAAENDTGHYMPPHGQALAQTKMQTIQYLANAKPKPAKIGLLDKEISPTKAQEAKYERTLTIANNPVSIMEHVKHGTLQLSDVQDLNAMYPALYKNMNTKLINAITSNHADKGTVPYKTKLAIGLFTGSPIDASMQSMNIQAAQATAAPQQPPQQGTQPKKGSPSKVNTKNANQYKTASQEAESDRSNRD